MSRPRAIPRGLIRTLSTLFACAILFAYATLTVGAEPLSFQRDIRPILSNHCFKCHGPAMHEGELRLDALESAGSELPSGKRAIVPGKAEQSELVARISAHDPTQRMPPEGQAPPLSAEQIGILTRWIAEGAKYEPHWAYVPPRRPPVPKLVESGWIRNELDAFVLEKILAEGMKPAPEADRTTLIRRLSLDLIGLPPALAEVAAFVADESPGAYNRLVDRLLDSPQYGVRQAIAWLDLARYADSDGYPHDGYRSVWPYRDWVVEAYNRDMPYDEFTIQQLAGDMLPGATDEHRLASAFHRQTRINREAGVDPEEFRLEAVIDRVNTTASVWLGATLGCAQCHDHKYDPYSQRDYYRLLAYFNNGADETSTDPAGKITDISPRMSWSSPAMNQRRAELTELIAQQQDAERRVALERERDALAPVETLVMRELPQPRPTHILVRGSFTVPGESVPPGVPAVLGSTVPPIGSDRLTLARWLVDPHHPLTARVAVNRLWAQYFGTGLVETLDDFGSQGAACSHPELLDWLATELERHRWHWKPLHRLIVTSATYRQRAVASAESRQRDPQNRLLAHFPRVRLPAELVRDVALASGGTLNLELGGPSVGPEVVPPGTSGARYRRSIYVRWKRQTLDDLFVTFDAPSREVSCTRRARTNTPLQALAMLNDRVLLDAARGLAERARTQSADWNQQLDFAFSAVTARQPEESERNTLRDLFARRREAFSKNPQSASALLGSEFPTTGGDDLAERAAWVLVANTLLNLNETITRE